MDDYLARLRASRGLERKALGKYGRDLVRSEMSSVRKRSQTSSVQKSPVLAGKITEADLKAAVAKAKKRGDWAEIRDIRRYLPGSRSEQDAALKAAYSARKINLTLWDDQRIHTADDQIRKQGVPFGGQIMDHIFWSG